MAHFAQLDESSIVTNVIVVNNNELLDENGNESEQKGIDFCVNLLGGKWVQTSYNNNFRKNYAGIGFIYDPIRDAFYPPQCSYPSWLFNEDTCRWQPPTPMPVNGKANIWDEATTSWIEAPTE